MPPPETSVDAAPSVMKVQVNHHSLLGFPGGVKMINVRRVLLAAVVITGIMFPPLIFL
jgi:uncharacterized protein GlcG (DUF336 family)